MHISTELKQHVDSEMHILKEKKRKRDIVMLHGEEKDRKYMCSGFKVQSVLHHCEND